MRLFFRSVTSLSKEEVDIRGNAKCLSLTKQRCSFLAMMVLLAFFGLVSSNSAMAATVEMTPNAVGTEGGGNVWSGGAADWTNWQSSDDATTTNFLTNNGATDFVTVNLTDPGLTANDRINSVTTWIACFGAGDPAPIIYNLPGGPYEGPLMILGTTAFDDFSTVFVNPGGGNNWVNTDLANMEIGVDQASGGKGDTDCTAASAVVDYTTRVQVIDIFENRATSEYTPTADVLLAKVHTTAGDSGWGFDLTDVKVTLTGTLDPTGAINVYWSTSDDWATALGGGSVGTCASPVIDSQCNIPLNASIYQETGYLFFALDLDSGVLGDYSLSIDDFVGDSSDTVGLPKASEIESVKPPTQTLDYFYDYGQNFNANSNAGNGDVLLARIDTNKTSEGKPFANVSVVVEGDAGTPAPIITGLSDIKVWWKADATAPVGDSFADADVVGSVATPTPGTPYNISMTDGSGSGVVKGYIYFSISVPAGASGEYSLKVLSMRDNKGDADDNLPLPVASSTCNVTDPYAIVVCGDCHAYPPYESGTRGTPEGAILGTHSTHARFNPMECTVCHGDTTEGETKIAHRNDRIQIREVLSTAGSYSNGTSFAQVTNPTFGTCSNINCHNGIDQDWGSGALMECNDCHLSNTGDTDDFGFDGFTGGAVPRLYSAQWAGRGHGKTGSNYAYTDNPAAGLGCDNCHDEGIPHGDQIIPFRTNATGNMDIFCQNCHGTAAEIGSLFTAISTSAEARGIRTHSQSVFEDVAYKTMTTWRVQTLKCIDCHDPHGDTNNGMIHEKVWTGGSDTKGRPLSFFNGYSTVVFSKETGIDSYGMGPTTPKDTYICEVCHTRTDFHRQGGVGSHNDGKRCPDCHRHDKGWAPYEKCTECHAVARNYLYNVRQIVENNGDGGGDFVKSSRHVNNGGGAQIVTPYDCAVCHAEADYDKINNNQGFKSALHNDGTTSGVDAATDRKVHLRDVDNPDQVFIWNKNEVDPGVKEGYRTNMDNFCMACHDADGASGIAVNAGDNGLDMAPSPELATKPFNSNDTLRNGRDLLPSRPQVVNVKDQFNPANPSHHAVIQKRYSSDPGTAWNGAWSNHTLKNGNNVNTTREQSTLHCSDCHLTEQNAHGATNAWHMLQSGDPTTTGDTEDYNPVGIAPDDATNGIRSIVCYKCHAEPVYSATADPGSRFSHDTEGRVWANADFGGQTDLGAKLGAACLMCHSGDGYGHIHGRGSVENSDNGKYPSNGTSFTKYRFFPGAYISYAPGADDGGFSDNSSAGACYTATKTTSWAACGGHVGAKTDVAAAYSRGIAY